MKRGRSAVTSSKVSYAIRYTASTLSVFMKLSAMTPEYLAKPLTPFPLPTTDGWMLRTIGDTGAYILALPKRRKRLAHWEQVRRLIVKQAGVATVTQQVHHALSKDDKLDVFAFESITSARRWRSAQKLEEE